MSDIDLNLGAIDRNQTHFWVSGVDKNIPVTPTGELPPVNGETYVGIVGSTMGVRKDEIFPARIGANGAVDAVIDQSVEIVVFTKARGSLSKTIKLDGGKVVSDGSNCAMAAGTAERIKVEIPKLDPLAGLATVINGFNSRQAYALGRIKDGYLDQVRVVETKQLNGRVDPAIIARNQEHIVLDHGKLGFVLFDSDYKGAPEAIKSKINAAGGDVWPILCEVLPQLRLVARCVRASTSSNLRNRDTGQTYPGSGGAHTVVIVADASDVQRLLYDFHDRLWLAGLGWGFVGGAGQFLDHSLIDKFVGTPERLIFEGPPVVVLPLVQGERKAVSYPGGILDTKAACPRLTAAEKVEFARLKDAEKARLKPEMEAARAKWSESHIKRMVASGMSEADAKARVNRWLDRQELTDDFPLPFDDPKLAGTTVADVLVKPDKYIGKTLADPFEGPAYGRGKAILYKRADGSLFINSFAHGGIRYELRAAPTPAVEAEIERLARLDPLAYALVNKKDQRGGSASPPATSTGWSKPSAKPFALSMRRRRVRATSRSSWLVTPIPTRR
jgi:hypothetical protein